VGDALRLALTTFSIARVRGPQRLDRRTAGRAMVLGPGVGLLLGGLAAGLALGVRELQPGGAALLPAALAVTALALLTRGLHLDGLVDTADGLASYAPAERALQIMKSPGAGALGTATLLLAVVVQVAALASCLAAGRGALSLVLAVVLGRVAVVAACTPATPAASPTGLGSLVAGTVRRGVPLVLAVAVAGLGALVAALDGSGSDRAVGAGRAVLAVAVALLAARLLRRHVVRRLGGITGDVLGALIEVTTTVALVVMALDRP
jgi:adenosylcobinamide-GDP ribazoletransferase